MINACNFVFCKRIDKSMRFAIVTPVFNGEKFLDQSILSVVSQTGPFTIRYHVQDGGSKDRTSEIILAAHLAAILAVARTRIAAGRCH